MFVVKLKDRKTDQIINVTDVRSVILKSMNEIFIKNSRAEFTFDLVDRFDLIMIVNQDARI